ncbi:MAG TPA: ABC transporter permease [Verrucomicrobiales bacterium]|nr:ABC transporter permease [Verrucomicrobiales bacterium]
MLPFAYALRNLVRDPVRLLQTVGGSALVVLLMMTACSLTSGMRRVLGATGSPRNVLLLGAGSEESVERSEILQSAAGIAETSLRGIAAPLDQRAVSPEIHFMTFLEADGLPRRQARVRGVTPMAFLTYPGVRIQDGAFPRSGEILAGRLAWRRLNLPEEVLQPGGRLRLDGVPVSVSGVFAAPGTVMESEIWADLGDLRTFAQRETLSCVVLRLGDAAYQDIDLFTKQRLDLELSAVRESDYYGRLAEFFAPLRAMTWITAALVASGAVLGGLNTLYAAFASRIREMATLQAIGFGRPALAFSLVQESLVACLLGTLLASALALAFLDGRTAAFSIGSYTLEISPGVALTGLLTGATLGILGALPAVWRCLRPPLPEALRS